MVGFLIDTSVFVAAEQGRPVGEVPSGEAEGRISVATVTELSLGVRKADRAPVRELRQATLEHAGAFIALPYDEVVAHRLADLIARLRSERRSVGLMDTIIAATALTHDLVVWTLDGDFSALKMVEPELQLWPG